MKRRWFNFEHPVPAGRPFTAAHLVDEGTTAPSCDNVGAHTIYNIISNEREPRGFIVACCKCLALSEISNG